MAALLGQRPDDAFAGIERKQEARDLTRPAVAARERQPQRRERQRLQREPGAAGPQRREPQLPERFEERERRDERDRPSLPAGGAAQRHGAGATRFDDQVTAA